MRKTVTILIAARNEEPWIAQTLQSLALQTRRPDRPIIVVDDASDDRTGAIAAGLGARVIRLRTPSGKKSVAQNAALSSITTDIVVTVDADTTLDPFALERLIRPFESENPPTGTYGYVVSQKPRTVFQRGRDIEMRAQQFFQKRAQDLWNVPLVAPGCIAAWQVSAIRKRQNGFASSSLAEDMDLTMEIIAHQERFSEDGRGRVMFVRDALAFTIDPKTLRLYWCQVMRWYAAFFQNLRTHWKTLCLFKRPRLSLFVFCYLFDGILGFSFFFLLPLVALGLRWTWDWQLLGWTIFGFILARAVMMTGLSLYEGFRITRLTTRGLSRKAIMHVILSPKETLLSLPCYLFITDPLNRILWPIAFVRELPIICRWFSVSTWKKGH